MKYADDDRTQPAHAEPSGQDVGGESSSQAQIVRRLIKARAMLQESRNRSAELQGALERFKFAQAKLVGR